MELLKHDWNPHPNRYYRTILNVLFLTPHIPNVILPRNVLIEDYQFILRSYTSGPSSAESGLA